MINFNQHIRRPTLCWIKCNEEHVQLTDAKRKVIIRYQQGYIKFPHNSHQMLLFFITLH